MIDFDEYRRAADARHSVALLELEQAERFHEYADDLQRMLDEGNRSLSRLETGRLNLAHRTLVMRH